MQHARQVVNGIAGHRFQPATADHALLICHGGGGHGGIYDVFCEPYARAGADVWTLDLPGFGRSVPGRRGAFTAQDWVDATTGYVDEIKATTGLPVVVLGSSLGSFAAFAATLASDNVSACVLMGGAAVPGQFGEGVGRKAVDWSSEQIQALVGQLGSVAVLKIDRLVDFDVDYGFTGAGQEKHRDPLNTWEIELSAWASLYTYRPPVDAADNTKPVLFSVGDNDPIVTVDQVKAVSSAVGGPVEMHVMPGAPHQLMLFRTHDYVPIVREFVERTVL